MKKFFAVIIFLLLASGALTVSAQPPPAVEGPLIKSELSNLLFTQYLDAYQEAAKLELPGKSLSDLSFIFINLIFNALLISGAIFVGLMVYAGSRWLFSHGNEEEITKAKNLVLHTMIGLAIVLSAYTISFYILRAATGVLFYSTSEVRDINQYRADENYDPEQGDIFPW